MMPSDTQRLQEIEARANAEGLSEAPWRVRESVWEGSQTVEGPRGFDDRTGDTFHVLIDEPADADFIAHSREDVPFLLALVSRYAGAIAEIEALYINLHHVAAECVAEAIGEYHDCEEYNDEPTNMKAALGVLQVAVEDKIRTILAKLREMEA